MTDAIIALRNYIRVDLQSVAARVGAMGPAVADAEISVEAEAGAGASWADGVKTEIDGIRIALTWRAMRVAKFIYLPDMDGHGVAYYQKLRELGERFAAARAEEEAAS